MIRFMVQNDLSPRYKVEVNDEMCSMDKLTPYLSRIYENLYSILENNRIEELKVSETYFKDDTFAYLI